MCLVMSSRCAAGMAHEMDERLANLRKIVRRHVGRHADGDAAGSIHQQVRNAAGQIRWFFAIFVVIGNEVDGVFVDIFEKRFAKARSCALRYIAWRPVDLRRRIRSCPGRPRACSDRKNPAPSGRGRRKWDCHRADGSSPSLRRRSWRTCGRRGSTRGPCRACRKECGDGRVSSHREHRAERGR